MLTIQVLVVGELQTNCYLVFDPKTRQTLIVDPADAPEYISDVLTRQSLTPIGILATHGHFDHIMGAFGLQVMYVIPFYIHENDMFLVDRMQSSARHFLKRNAIDPAPRKVTFLKDGETIPVRNGSVKIIHVPGHTPGSVGVAVLDASALLTGDALFSDGSVGRTDHTYSDPNALTKSITRMVGLPGITKLYPGHGEPVPIDRAKIMFGV